MVAHADDVALVAANERGMKRMIRVLKKYVKRTGLEVNVRKTKIMKTTDVIDVMNAKKERRRRKKRGVGRESNKGSQS